MCACVSDLVSVCRVLVLVCVCGSGKECHAYFAASATPPEASATTNASYHQQQTEYALLLCSNEFYLVFRFNHMRALRDNHVIQPDTHTRTHTIKSFMLTLELSRSCVCVGGPSILLLLILFFLLIHFELNQFN